MFQVKGWVSEQLNVNLLIKQIHLDYLGLRDIKQVPSLLCKVPALLLASSGADKPHGQLCFVPRGTEHCSGTTQHHRAVFSLGRPHCCSGFCFKVYREARSAVPGGCQPDAEERAWVGRAGCSSCCGSIGVRGRDSSPCTALPTFTSASRGLIRH